MARHGRNTCEQQIKFVVHDILCLRWLLLQILELSGIVLKLGSLRLCCRSDNIHIIMQLSGEGGGEALR